MSVGEVFTNVWATWAIFAGLFFLLALTAAAIQEAAPNDLIGDTAEFARWLFTAMTVAMLPLAALLGLITVWAA